MIDIKNLRKHYDEDAVFITAHAAERFRLRNIKGNADKMKLPRFAQMRCAYLGDKPQA